jgi:hypothetical protein
MTDSTVKQTSDSRLAGFDRTLRQWTSRTLTVVFGGRPGLVLYLGCLVWFGLVWQLGFFINDNYTLANAAVNLADGRLTLDTIAFGPTDQSTPGMTQVDGETYGRAYGVVAAGVVFYWILAAVSQVANISILLVGGWSVLLYVTVWLGGDLLDRPRRGSLLGGTIASVAFLVNSVFAADIAARWLPLLGLQLATILTAGFVCVFLYRLFARMYGRRVGIAAGLTATLGTPVVFWSTIPKRHAFTAALAMASLYAFYRSRSAETASARLRFRALAYVPAGLTGWIQVADAALLVVPLAVVDVLTAKENGLRELSTVALVGFLSCIPAFLTNTLISGSPIESPMLIGRSLGGPSPETAPSVGSGSGSESVLQALLYSFQTSIAPLSLFSRFLIDGATNALDIERTVDVFIRGGYIEGVTNRDAATIRLALLEAAPVIGAVVATPIQTLRWLRTGGRLTPRIATDLFVGSYVLLFGIFYMRVLPWHASVTVRHLLPLYPALVYGVFRVAAVRRVLGEWRLLAGTGFGTVIVGIELLVLLTLFSEYRVGEAVQLLAVGALGIASVLAGWVLWRTIATDLQHPTANDRTVVRLGAVVLGLAVGWGALSMLVLRLLVLPSGNSIVTPIIQWILGLIPLF